jgi:hypothetical protein
MMPLTKPRKKETGIARRTYEYIANKSLKESNHCVDGINWPVLLHRMAGGTINSWPIRGDCAKVYRAIGAGREIQEKSFALSRQKFRSKILGLTTGLAVMKINHELGYRPVTFSELTDDEEFWKGCMSCVNYDILMRTNKSKCLCTGMLYDPAWYKDKNDQEKKADAPKSVIKGSLLDIINKLKPNKGGTQESGGNFNMFRKKAKIE